MKMISIICLILACFFIAAMGQAENDKTIRAVETDTPSASDGKTESRFCTS